MGSVTLMRVGDGLQYQSTTESAIGHLFRQAGRDSWCFFCWDLVSPAQERKRSWHVFAHDRLWSQE